MNRKEFIKLSAMGAAALSVGSIANLWAAPAKISTDGFQKYPRNKVTFPQIDFGTQVFSKCGSWLVLDYAEREKTHRIRLRTLRSSAISYKWDNYWACDFYDIALFKNNTELKYTATASPYNLNLKTSEGELNITFSDNDTLFFEAHGVEVHLLPLQKFSWTYQNSPKELKLHLRSAHMMNHFKTFSDTSLHIQEFNNTEDKSLNQKLIIDGLNSITFSLRISQSDTVWSEPISTYSEAYTKTKAEVDTWMAKMPSVPSEFFDAAQTAWYLLHAFQVAPAGKITRQSVLSSKNSWLTKVWSWDNCFHAMALAHADVKLAWDQLFVMFDNQNENGAFPDALDDNGGNFSFVKPPVHGWTIQNIINTTGVDASMPFIKEAYEPLVKWNNYWYNFRDDNKNGMCHYLNGNDSGSDNSTAFDQGMPTEGADLAAYLVLQQQTLGYMARLLGKNKEASQWEQKAATQYKNLLQFGVSDGKFISPLASTGKAAPSQSLINYVPLMLGKQLDAKLSQNMVADLQLGGRYFTDFGLASEAIDSLKYKYDGYWRGPIWAPTNYQLFCGLNDMGNKALAKTIAHRFCEMCAIDTSFSENYDPLTGKGIQAPGVCWTPAVFMLFAHWLDVNK